MASLSTLTTIKLRASFFKPESRLYFNSFLNEFFGNRAKRFNRPEVNASNCTILDSTVLSWFSGNLILNDQRFPVYSVSWLNRITNVAKLKEKVTFICCILFNNLSKVYFILCL